VAKLRGSTEPDDEAPAERSAWRSNAAFVKAMRELGLEIRRCRERQKLTLEQAAEVIGIDYRHLAKIESGSLNPTAFTLFRIAGGLGVTLRALAGKAA
jgi:DNA-binding XRE family transcriptional regulator